MTDQTGGQLAFDFDELAREDARASLDEWSGAPLHFTTDYYPPHELDEAFAHWCFLNTHFDSYASSHMWHRAITIPGDMTVGDGEHTASTFTAELRPRVGQEGPGGLLTQLICEPCEWHAINGDENHAVEAWHDHAFPNWRDLPVIPTQIRVRSESGLTKLATAWIAEHYPVEAQVPGATIITARAPHGTRHVAGYSPWGGYDLSATALDRPAQASTPSKRALTRALPQPLSPAAGPARPAPVLGA